MKLAARRIPYEYEKFEGYPLVDGREVLFAAEYLKDFDAARAYVVAGFPKENATKHAWQMVKRPNVQLLIRNRMEKMIRRAEISVENILQKFSEIADANLADFMVIGEEDGLPHWDFSLITREKMAAVQEATVTSYFDGTKTMKEDPETGEMVEVPREVKQVKIKLYNKTEALVNLAKFLRMYLLTESDDRSQTIVIEGGLPPRLPAPDARDQG